MHIYVQIAVNLAAAWVAGGVIGIERSYHGRAAGRPGAGEVGGDLDVKWHAGPPEPSR